MRSPSLVRLLPACLFVTGLAADVRAQQTIFNVPSPDVLERGGRYVETDQYLRPGKTGNDRAAFFLVRAVVGAGHSIEVGCNAGAFDYIRASAPFIDAAVKWRPFDGIILGDNAGVGVGGEVSGRVRNVVYGAGSIRVPSAKTRASAGPYLATRYVFTDRARFGAQVTFEQPIPGARGLVLAADWFSGERAAATTGLIWTVRRMVLYAGYGFANTGRSQDLVTLELGLNL